MHGRLWAAVMVSAAAMTAHAASFEPANDVTVPWSTLEGSLAVGFVPPA